MEKDLIGPRLPQCMAVCHSLVIPAPFTSGSCLMKLRLALCLRITFVLHTRGNLNMNTTSDTMILCTAITFNRSWLNCCFFFSFLLFFYLCMGYSCPRDLRTVHCGGRRVSFVVADWPRAGSRLSLFVLSLVTYPSGMNGVASRTK
jgi:hypothetical protein